MKLAFKKILHSTHAIVSEKIESMDSDDYEKKIESMAEDLVNRITRLHKRLGALCLSDLSEKEMAKIRTWADKENDELLHLKETISKRKLSYIRTISTNDLIRLANHHPVWKTHCNVYMDQIQRMTLTREGEHAFVRCTLTPHVLNSLKIFHDAGDGKILCINSDRGLRYEEQSGEKVGVRWILVNDNLCPLRDNMFHMVERIRAQWIFTDATWGLDDQSLWLDFAT